MRSRNSGLNSFQHQVKELQKRIESATQPEQVPLDVLLHPAFMKQHTNFGTIEEMVEASGFQLSQESEESAQVFFASEAWNNFVASNSLFAGWDAMIQAAGEEYISKKLKGL